MYKYYDNGDGYAHLVADNFTTVNLTPVESIGIKFGSTVKVIQDGKSFVLDDNNNWQQIPANILESIVSCGYHDKFCYSVVKE